MLKLYRNRFRFTFASIRIMSLSTGLTHKDSVDLSDLRTPYHPDEFELSFPKKDPFMLFDVWFSLALKTDGIKEANAMAVATADLSGKPSVRYLLLKGYGRDGFRFFTNYESRKGKELAENPNVSLLFYWEPLYRQIRIEGTVVKLDEKESEEYFHSRPRSSQISASISHQSSVIEGKDILLKKQKDLEEKYADESTTIPKPDFWGGFKVIPKSFEFWNGRSSRLHDRLRFRLPVSGEIPDNKLSYPGENGWIYEHLSP